MYEHVCIVVNIVKKNVTDIVVRSKNCIVYQQVYSHHLTGSNMHEFILLE